MANHLSSVPPGASQGSLALTPGQQIAMWDTNANAWRYLGVTNGTLTVFAPSVVPKNGSFTNLTVATPLYASQSVLLNGYAVDTSGDTVNGIEFLLNHNLSGNRQLGIGDSATGYGLRIQPGATTLMDGFLVGTGETPFELQPGGSPLIVGGKITFAGETNTEVKGAAVLGTDANGHVIVGSTSGGATVAVQTNAVQLNASAATLDIAGGAGIQVTGTVSGSVAHIGITATGGGGGGSLIVQTNGTQLSAAATTLNVQGGSNVLVNGSASGGAAMVSLVVTGTVPAAVTAQSIGGGTGPGSLSIPDNNGGLITATNDSLVLSNGNTTSKIVLSNDTVTAAHFVGALTGTASGNDASGASTGATNGLAGPQLASQIGTTPVARATADASGNTITTTYEVATSDLAQWAGIPTNATVPISVQTAVTVGSAILTNLCYGTNALGRALHPTNAVDGVNLSATTMTASMITNASFNIAGFSDLITGFRHLPSVCYSNSSASPITIGAPPGARLIGAVTSSSLSVGAGKQAQYSFWIEPGIKTNMVNVVEP